MTISVSEQLVAELRKLQVAEVQLASLALRLEPCAARDHCYALLAELRKEKARVRDIKAALREAITS
jgi:hypothetical protein